MPSVSASFLDTLAPDIARIDGWLAECIDGADLPENLRDAARHAVLVGGKRLRPLLVSMWCQACGGGPDDGRDGAVAIELIHAFSLVHDDLPALDNDLLRRGQPTVHAKYGEAMAILAGDLLMSLAFESVAAPRCPPGLTGELATATTRMINGQVLDTLGGFPPSETDPLARLRRIHGSKTGALITAACRMGARAARAPAHALRAATEYGDAIGLMFQIVDDLLDVTQSTEHLGKAAGKDQTAGKLTFPGVLGVAASREQVQLLHQDARRALTLLTAPFGHSDQQLADLADYMAVRTR